MAKTINLGLEVGTDDKVLFKDWRNAINGQGAGTAIDPKSNTQIIDEFAGAVIGVSGVTLLVAANWVNGVYTLAVASLGAYDAIFFSPITSADKTAIEDADVVVSTNDKTVTFTAATTPTASIGLNYFIARGKA